MMGGDLGGLRERVRERFACLSGSHAIGAHIQTRQRPIIFYAISKFLCEAWAIIRSRSFVVRYIEFFQGCVAC